MEVPPKPANDNEPQGKAMDRVGNVGYTKLTAMATVLGTIAHKGFSSPEGKVILANLMKGLFN